MRRGLVHAIGLLLAFAVYFVVRDRWLAFGVAIAIGFFAMGLARE